jgi:hypothetical protein
LKRGGLIMGGGGDWHGSPVLHGMTGKGMGGEGESSELKKKGRPIRLCWVVFSSSAGVQLNEGNK